MKHYQLYHTVRYQNVILVKYTVYHTMIQYSTVVFGKRTQITSSAGLHDHMIGWEDKGMHDMTMSYYDNNTITHTVHS